jgi:hypothetical protein
MRNTFKILVNKHEENTSLGRPRHRWEDSLPIFLIEMAMVAVPVTGHEGL